MGNQHLVVINSGSSSIKFAIYTLNKDLKCLYSGVVENLQNEPLFKLFDQSNHLIRENQFHQINDYKYYFELLFNALKSNSLGIQIVAAGHRVVHGSNFFNAPVIVTSNVITQLKSLIPYAPLHQPYNLEAIEIIAHLYPDLKQIACFDTSFHTTHPPVADRFGLPRYLIEEGIKRYGFHGLSYEYIMHQLRLMDAQKAQGRIIIAHLGNGASLCAVKEGRCIDSTMGFTAMDGLVMGTRCGNLDPGVVLYLLQSKGMTPEEIQHLLYKESGLLGVSGTTSNMQQLLNNQSIAAQEAIELFVYRIRRELGALIAVLGGIDTMIFTGGIGEHAWQIREAICEKNEWVGIHINPMNNKTNQSAIHDPQSQVDVLVIPTHEEWMIAHHCYNLIF